MNAKPIKYIDAIQKIEKNNENSFIAYLNDGSIIDVNRVFHDRSGEWEIQCTKKIAREDGALPEAEDLPKNYFDIIKNMDEARYTKKR